MQSSEFKKIPQVSRLFSTIGRVTAKFTYLFPFCANASVTARLMTSFHVGSLTSAAGGGKGSERNIVFKMRPCISMRLCLSVGGSRFVYLWILSEMILEASR